MLKKQLIFTIRWKALRRHSTFFIFLLHLKTGKIFQLLNSSHVMLRTEALTRLSAGGNKKIIITYPEALFEKVVLPKNHQRKYYSYKNK